MHTVLLPETYVEEDHGDAGGWTDDIKQWTGISVADCVQRARDRSVWTVGILGVRVGDLRSSDMRKDLGKARLHKS